MLATKRSAGVAPDINLRYPLCIGHKACKSGIDPSFETQGICHQKSITVSVAPEKGLPIFFFEIYIKIGKKECDLFIFSVFSVCLNGKLILTAKTLYPSHLAKSPLI